MALLSNEEVAKLKIRITGADGRLVRSGFWWWEFQVKTYNKLVSKVRWAALVIAIGIIGAIIGLANGNGGVVILFVVIVLLGGSWLWNIHSVQDKTRVVKRQLEFCDDGQILFTYTAKQHPDKPPVLEAMPKTHDSIVRIEAAAPYQILVNGVPQMKQAVVMYFNDGQEMPVSVDQDKVSARMLVVALTEALAELRKSTGKMPVVPILID
jgi:hypothetical protein